MEVGFVVDASGFTNFTGQMHRAVSDGMANEHLLRGFENAQATYLGDMREQFQANSRGGGLWPDLAPSTKLKRYQQAGGRFKKTKGVTRADRLAQVAKIPFPILYLTGHLYTSLYPDSPDNIFMHSNDSVSAGTQVPYAEHHQRGGPRLPQRQILHQPTERLLAAMTLPIVAGFRALIEDITGISLPSGGTSLGRAA